MNNELEKKVISSLEEARGIIVSNQESFSRASQFLLGIKSLQKEISTVFDPIIEAAHYAHKEALSQKKKIEEPLVQAERIVKPRITAYLIEQERIRREQEEARRKAEEERLRFEEETFRKAQEAELRALTEKDAVMRQAAKNEADRILEQAAARENEIPSIPVTVVKPKMDGLSTREIWRFEIVNASAIPREYMLPDTVKIGKIVQLLKGKASIPGVRVYSEKILAARIL